jgi:Ca2+/H+ antiporter, TMEM165/GDT1 family
MKRGFIARKVVKILLVVAAAILLFGFIVMSLWNAILPAVIHVGTITFAQALGILVLSKILFGGFHGGGWGGRRRQWREKMKEKWEHMTPEQRTQFKEDWQHRCSKWKRPATGETTAAE